MQCRHTIDLPIDFLPNKSVFLEGGQPSPPELNQFLSHHIIKRAGRAALIAAKEEPHLACVAKLCRDVQHRLAQDSAPRWILWEDA